MRKILSYGNTMQFFFFLQQKLRPIFIEVPYVPIGKDYELETEKIAYLCSNGSQSVRTERQISPARNFCGLRRSAGENPLVSRAAIISVITPLSPPRRPFSRRNLKESVWRVSFSKLRNTVEISIRREAAVFYDCRSRVFLSSRCRRILKCRELNSPPRRARGLPWPPRNHRTKRVLNDIT
ncbi:hypothetical protein PUN28_000187 [Cardiocondyla obscurior]|uniref:Uncharacterized protein n=1 Tax=Cardiocondyla obscurior TaxID=286306 RepID=A0AAW2GY34_9HYME